LDGVLRLVDVETETSLAEFSLNSRIEHISFSSSLFVALDDGSVAELALVLPQSQ
jgi:hypothetical protein